MLNKRNTTLTVTVNDGTLCAVPHVYENELLNEWKHTLLTKKLNNITECKSSTVEDYSVDRSE